MSWWMNTMWFFFPVLLIPWTPQGDLFWHLQQLGLAKLVSHCPMQGGEGHLRRLLWLESKPVSPRGHSFKLWPACFAHGIYTDPGSSQCNSTKCLLGASALVYCFHEDLVFSGTDQTWGSNFVENCIWQRVIPVYNRREFTFGWQEADIKLPAWRVGIMYLKSLSTLSYC